MTREMTGAKMVVQALKDQGVDTVFGSSKYSSTTIHAVALYF